MGGIPKKISEHTLNHTLMWADFCSKNENYKWTKSDALLVLLIKEEIKKIGHDRYIKRRNETNTNKIDKI